MSETVFNFAAFLATLLLVFSFASPVNADSSRPDLSNQIVPGAAPTKEPQNSIGNAPEITALPVISVWNRSSLRFGKIGNPQRQINVLGNVHDSDGNFSTLSYRLNQGSLVTVPVGPDNIRLVNPGDFNIALNTLTLKDGDNTVELIAVDKGGGTTRESLTVNYTKNQSWPQQYTTNWAGAGAINQQAQVVDGLWQIVSGGVQTQEVGYDRLIAIGDRNWLNDYEVTVPITVHSFHPVGDDSGGVGVIVRWQGHEGTSVLPTDWTRIGAYAYYSNKWDGGGLALRLNSIRPVVQQYPFQLGLTYIFKVRAETVPQGGRYSFKVWKQGQPEPPWSDSAFSQLVNVIDSNNDLLQGSMLLVAHRADATFGDVTIRPVNVPSQVLNNKIYLPMSKQ